MTNHHPSVESACDRVSRSSVAPVFLLGERSAKPLPIREQVRESVRMPCNIDDLLELMRARRSVRKFTHAPLESDEVAMVLEAFRWAPSAGNAQPWHVRIVRDDLRKRELARAAVSQQFVAQAPLVLVVCADHELAHRAYRQRGVDLYCLQDTAAAIQNALLAIHAMGLGSCWIGAFREQSVATILALPDHLRPIAIVAVGHADEVPPTPPRRPWSEFTSDE